MSDASRMAARRLLGARETRRFASQPFELREVPNGTGGTSLIFTGWATVTDRSYAMWDQFGEFSESVARGAFRDTLAAGADVAFLLNHTGMPLARTAHRDVPGTLALAEDSTGLYVEARLDPGNSIVRDIRSGVERGDLDEMSMAFRVVDQLWNEAFDDRVIRSVDLDKGDVSVVTYGANDHTGGLVSIGTGAPGAGFGQLGRSTPLPELLDYGAEARVALAEARRPKAARR